MYPGRRRESPSTRSRSVGRSSAATPADASPAEATPAPPKANHERRSDGLGWRCSPPVSTSPHTIVSVARHRMMITQGHARARPRRGLGYSSGLGCGAGPRVRGTITKGTCQNGTDSTQPAKGNALRHMLRQHQHASSPGVGNRPTLLLILDRREQHGRHPGRVGKPAGCVPSLCGARGDVHGTAAHPPAYHGPQRTRPRTTHRPRAGTQRQTHDSIGRRPLSNKRRALINKVLRM